MGNAFDKVTTQQVVIDDMILKKQRYRLSLVAYNFLPLRNYAEIVRGPEVMANMLAGQIAVEHQMRIDKLQHKFSLVFQKYHKACVQVISTDTQGRETVGSGILFEASETQLILFTVAHAVPNHLLEYLVIECNYTFSDNIRVDKIKIPINRCRKIIDTMLDAAVFLFDDIDSDIVRKKIRKFPRIASMETASDRVMCIHHGGSYNFKTICVGTIGSVPGNFAQLRPKVHIDGGPGASGAPLFNIEGDVIAILQSSQPDKTRSFLPMERILNEIDCRSENSRLQLDLHMVESYEGTESKRLLLDKCQDVGINTSGKKVKCLIGELERSHLNLLNQTVFECLGVGNSYNISNHWSLDRYVESDHFPPCNAYKLAGITLKKTFLPAITIPRIIHRKLATTGSYTTSDKFRSTQAKCIKQGKFVQAVMINFYEYKVRGLFRQSNYNCSDHVFKMLQQRYLQGFAKALEQHQALNLITAEEKDTLYRKISSIIENGKNRGDKLAESDKIGLECMPTCSCRELTR